MRTRQAAWRYVQTTVRPQDRVAIFTATGKDQLDFTSDQSKLHDALYRTLALPHSPSGCPAIDEYEAYSAHILNDPDALVVLHTDAIGCVCHETAIGEGRPVAGMGSAMEQPGGRGAVDPCPPQAERQGELEAAVVWARVEAESLRALDAIERSVRRLAAMPGQRNLVLVSPGFLTETEKEKIDAITDRALQQQVVVSAIDAAGLVTGLPKPKTEVPSPSARRSDQDEAAEHRCGGHERCACLPELRYGRRVFPQQQRLRGGLPRSRGRS